MNESSSVLILSSSSSATLPLSLLNSHNVSNLNPLKSSVFQVSGEVLPSWKTFGPVDQEIYPRLFLKINFDRDFAEVKIGFQEL